MTKAEKIIRGEQLAVELARLAHDRNCENIAVLDLRGVSPITDFFVIATGTSDRQMRSLADEMEIWGKHHKNKAWHIAGLESSQWVLLDFVDVIVHLFDREHREYYDLELIWGEAPRVQWDARAKKAPE